MTSALKDVELISYLKTKSKGFSLVELIISLVVASVLILMVGIISNIAFTSHEDLRKEAQVYDDLEFGVELIKASVRKASSISVVSTWTNPPYKGSVLIVDNCAFAVYQPQGSTTRDLIYIPNVSQPNTRQTIINKATSLAFTPIGGDSKFTFSTTTTDSDPGNRNLRLNNSTYSSVTRIYADLVNADNVDITTWLDSLDDSTSTIKGSIRLYKQSNSSVFAVFQLNSITTATGYRKLNVTYVIGNGTFSNADLIVFSFSPVSVRIQGARDKEAFDITNIVARRN
jgi:prepilin-type N-terminal cleavage/methylation domain-containing protein